MTANAESLTFTPQNWDIAQTVTLTAGVDEDDPNSWEEIIHSSETEGLVTGHVKVLIENNE